MFDLNDESSRMWKEEFLVNFANKLSGRLRFSEDRPVAHDYSINHLNAELKTVCHLLALLGAHHILHVSRMMDGWLEVSIRKSTRWTNSTQVFLGFPVSISKCSDGSQDSKLPLHASHVAIPT